MTARSNRQKGSQVLRSLRLALTLSLATPLLACGDANLIGPANALEIANNADAFEWQVSMLENVTQTLSYTWQNSGTTANVDLSSSITSGTATLSIADADGMQVYSGSLDQDGTFTTNAGAAGGWTIDVVLSGVDGTLNFRVDAP